MTKFEQATSAKLATIETRLEEQGKTLFKQLDELTRMIQGNGHPGLCTRVALLEDQQSPTNKDLGDRVAKIENRHAESDKKHSRKLEWATILATLAGTVYAIFFGGK